MNCQKAFISLTLIVLFSFLCVGAALVYCLSGSNDAPVVVYDCSSHNTDVYTADELTGEEDHAD